MPEHRPAFQSQRDEQHKVKAVLDTNVFVSGLMGVTSPPRQIVDAWLDGQFTLVTSLYLVEELAHVLSYPRIAERIHLDASEVDVILAALLSQADVVPGELQLPGATRDPRDDPVVACAVESRADYLVSDHRDLLDLETDAGGTVVRPQRFLDILREEQECHA